MSSCYTSTDIALTKQVVAALVRAVWKLCVHVWMGQLAKKEPGPQLSNHSFSLACSVSTALARPQVLPMTGVHPVFRAQVLHYCCCSCSNLPRAKAECRKRWMGVSGTAVVQVLNTCTQKAWFTTLDLGKGQVRKTQKLCHRIMVTATNRGQGEQSDFHEKGT